MIRKTFLFSLIKSISKKEGILQEELDRIPGTGKPTFNKSDLPDYIKNDLLKILLKLKFMKKI